MGTLLISSSPYLVSLLLFFYGFFFNFCLAMRLRIVLAWLALATTQKMHGAFCHAEEEVVRDIVKLIQLRKEMIDLRGRAQAIEERILAVEAEIHEQECNRTLTQSCQGTAISLEAFNKFYEEKRKSREYTEPCGALFGLNDPKKCDQEIYTRELCGLKRFFSKDSHCQRKTNQNYGCHRHSCWRSAIEKTEKWCYIAYWNRHTQTFDTNKSVYCTSAATCGNELTTRPCATRNTSG